MAYVGLYGSEPTPMSSPTTRYKITYYTHPGHVLTRQHTMAHTLHQAEIRAAYLYKRHHEHGPVRVWVRTDPYGGWKPVTTDENMRLIKGAQWHRPG